MKKSPVTDRCCPNPECPLYGKYGEGNISRHSFYSTKQGRRRRFLCEPCGGTFSSTAGTPYYRLKKPRKTFDEVATMSVEGMSKSSIARVKGLAWNTVAHWLELASQFAKRFNDRTIQGYAIVELQADEVCTFVQGKKSPLWIFTTLEVWSRLWVCWLVGRRIYENAKRVLSETCKRGRIRAKFLFTTNGYEPYRWAVKAVLGGACVYGQVIKTWRNNRVIQVEQRLRIGSEAELNEMLVNSEDSETLNTSFVERHNLTIRQGSSYLSRRSVCYARDQRYLENHMALLMCYYNFVRRHRALKFGNETRTPGMQAGLVSKRLSFRDIFTSREALFLCLVLVVQIRGSSLHHRGWRPVMATLP
jgi:transposase-like protein/IS1 family transposase